MLYALAMGFSIDVGKVIYYWIQHIHRASTIGGLGHPSLITELCQLAGVEIGLEEERTPTKAIIARASSQPHGHVKAVNIEMIL